MATVNCTIRPAPGGDGPFFVVSESDGNVLNVTTGLANVNAALDQCKTDTGAAIQGLTFKSTRITTTAS